MADYRVIFSVKQRGMPFFECNVNYFHLDPAGEALIRQASQALAAQLSALPNAGAYETTLFTNFGGRVSRHLDRAAMTNIEGVMLAGLQNLLSTAGQATASKP